MSKNEINTYLCAILSTLAVVEFAPESTLYLGIGADLGKWELLKSVLLRGGLAACENCVVTITPKGRAMAAKIDAMATA